MPVACIHGNRTLDLPSIDILGCSVWECGAQRSGRIMGLWGWSQEFLVCFWCREEEICIQKLV